MHLVQGGYPAPCWCRYRALRWRHQGATSQGDRLRLHRCGYDQAVDSNTPDDRPWWRRPDGMPGWMQRQVDASAIRELSPARILFLRLYLLFVLCGGIIAMTFGFWLVGFVLLTSPLTVIAIWRKKTRNAVFGALIRGKQREDREQK